ncbi:MAG TPA: glycosyltransferase family 39 protein [Jatrophihabitans sp.]|nr:glycosyltransferase family 39 protein [Jatrophihabitans sp.]
MSRSGSDDAAATARSGSVAVTAPDRPAERRPPLARLPVLSATVLMAILLTAFSNRYGFHRDELYFRMLRPAWGYVDQPPLAPLLARLFGHLSGSPWAIRIPATLAAAGSVPVVALVTRELGGGRRAQALSAWGYAFAAIPLTFGHQLLTSTLDLLVWPAVLLFILRARLREQPRWWLAAGVVVGLSMYNKLLIAVLLLALAAGILLVGPRRLLWSRWVLGAVLLALLIGFPNLVYQATHSWPQLSMGRALARNNGGQTRMLMWPLLLVVLGPPLVAIWLAGLVGLLRRPQWRPVRFVGAAFPVLLLLVFSMGAQFYYPTGLLVVLYAAGCVPVAEWFHRRPVRRNWVIAAVAVNAVVSVLVGLPVIPLSVLGRTPVPAMNQTARDTVGWPAYVDEVSAVYGGLPPADRARTVIVATNYGEAGAISRYGRGLPPVYSGHNQLYCAGPPPAGASVAIVVGAQLRRTQRLFAGCRIQARLDDRVGVDNEEQHDPIGVCHDPIGGWQAAWPQFRHLD